MDTPYAFSITTTGIQTGIRRSIAHNPYGAQNPIFAKARGPCCRLATSLQQSLEFAEGILIHFRRRARIVGALMLAAKMFTPLNSKTVAAAEN